MQALQWIEQGNRFELRSSDAELLRQAELIFDVQPREKATTQVTRSWQVERVRETQGDGWLVSGYSGSSSMIPATYDSRDRALVHVEQDAITWMLENASDTVAVHAALLSKNGHGVVIVGPSFAGKSTLATALWRSGWSLLSDDVVFIDSRARTASPAARRISLRYESRRLVGEKTWNEIKQAPSCIDTQKGLYFHAHEISNKHRMRVTDLSAIFFLARRDVDAGEAQVIEINHARAAVAFIPYAFNIRMMPLIDALRRVTPLFESVPAFDLGRGDLDAMVAAVEATVG